MEIRKLAPKEVDSAMELAERVFMQYNAYYFPMSMVVYFRDSLIRNPNFVNDYKNGTCIIYGAFLNGQIVGVLSLNKDSRKINLLFVKTGYHRKGIATRMIDTLLEENPQIHELFVNCPTGGKEFYGTYGFRQIADAVSSGSASFTPMQYVRDKK